MFNLKTFLLLYQISLLFLDVFAFLGGTDTVYTKPTVYLTNYVSPEGLNGAVRFLRV